MWYGGGLILFAFLEAQIFRSACKYTWRLPWVVHRNSEMLDIPKMVPNVHMRAIILYVLRLGMWFIPIISTLSPRSFAAHLEVVISFVYRNLVNLARLLSFKFESNKAWIGYISHKLFLFPNMSVSYAMHSILDKCCAWYVYINIMCT